MLQRTLIIGLRSISLVSPFSASFCVVVVVVGVTSESPCLGTSASSSGFSAPVRSVEEPSSSPVVSADFFLVHSPSSLSSAGFGGGGVSMIRDGESSLLFCVSVSWLLVAAVTFSASD
jgi:hypothetical protein